ncbi:MAG: hypothetical protein DWQ08_01915, partial [Proteobacteria bacterium]
GFDFASYANESTLSDLLSGLDGYVVVNRRVVENTTHGADSGHWYADVLSTGKWYPDDMEERTIERRDAALLYDRDGVRVYRLEARQD